MNDEHIEELILKGKKIDAIKAVMDATGKSLRDSKDYVEALEKRSIHTVKEVYKEQAEVKNEIIRCPECGSSSIAKDTVKVLGMFKKEKKICHLCKRRF